MASALDTFFAAWSESDCAKRAAAIGSVVAADGTYADPRTPEPMTGPGPLAEYVGMFTEAAPGATATVVKSDTQHGLTRATVEFKMSDGMAQMGQYFAEIDDDGMIARMVGFVGTGAPE